MSRSVLLNMFDLCIVHDRNSFSCTAVPLYTCDCMNTAKTCVFCAHQVITEALQAFIWILKFPLPAVEQNYDQLTKQLFVLLKDYAKAGAAHGMNFLLVQNCFKVRETLTAFTLLRPHFKCQT